MKPTHREKNLLDYLFGGFRSTLNVSYSSCWGYSLINTFKFKKKKFKPLSYTTGTLGVLTSLNLHSRTIRELLRILSGRFVVWKSLPLQTTTYTGAVQMSLYARSLVMLRFAASHTFATWLMRPLLIYMALAGTPNLTLFLCFLSLAFSTSLCLTKRGNLQFPPLPHSGPQRRHSKYVHYDASIASR